MEDEVLYGGCGQRDIDGNFIVETSVIDGDFEVDTDTEEGLLDVCLPSVEDIKIYFFVFDDVVITNEDKSYFGDIKFR
jgi:hypothetical protein